MAFLAVALAVGFGIFCVAVVLTGVRQARQQARLAPSHDAEVEESEGSCAGTAGRPPGRGGGSPAGENKI